VVTDLGTVLYLPLPMPEEKREEKRGGEKEEEKRRQGTLFALSSAESRRRLRRFGRPAARTQARF
jgi:hypothetical protein